MSEGFIGGAPNISIGAIDIAYLLDCAMHKIITSFAVLFFSFILWIIYLANTGSSLFFYWVRLLPHGDKIGHFLLFGFLTLLLNITFQLKSIEFKSVRIYFGTLLVSIFVLLEELSQGFIPTRTMDYRDLIADCLGILVFTIIYFVLSKKSCKFNRV